MTAARAQGLTDELTACSAAFSGQHDLTLLCPPGRVANCLHDVLAFKVGIIGQEFIEALLAEGNSRCYARREAQRHAIRAEDVSPDVIGKQVIAALGQIASELEEGALITVDSKRARLRVLPLKLRG